MAHLQINIEQCLAAIETHEDAILKLKAEVVKLRNQKKAYEAEATRATPISITDSIAIAKAEQKTALIRTPPPRHALPLIPTSPLFPTGIEAALSAAREPRRENAITVKNDDSSTDWLSWPTYASGMSLPKEGEVDSRKRDSSQDVASSKTKEAGAPECDSKISTTALPLATSTAAGTSTFTLPIRQTKRKRSHCELREVPSKRTFVAHTKLVDHTPKNCRLLNLPRELRDGIYRFAVAPGKVVIKSDTARQRIAGRAQAVDPSAIESGLVTYALFGTNKRIRAEAMEVYFKENLIMINSDRYANEILCIPSVLQPRRHSLGRNMRMFLTSIRISFDVRDHRLNTVLVTAGGMVPRPVGNRTPLEIEIERMVQVTRLQHKSTAMVMPWQSSLKHVLQECNSLRVLQLDMTHCYCVAGCCRQVSKIGTVLESTKVPDSLEIIEVFGTKSQSERTSLLEKLLVPRSGPGKPPAALGVKLKFVKFEAPEGPLKKLHQFGLDTALKDEMVDVGHDDALGGK